MDIFVRWHHNAKWKLLLFKFFYLVVRVHIISVSFDKVLDSFDLFKFVRVEFSQLNFNLPTILDIICDLKFLDGFEKLIFPNSLFWFFLSKYLFHINVINNFLNRDIQCVLRAFDFHFSCTDYGNLFSLLLFIYFLSFVFVFLFIILWLVDFEETTNLVDRENLSWFDNLFAID